MERYISLKDLSAIAGKYDLRRDVRAEAEIENMAVSGYICQRVKPEDDLPDNDGFVLVNVSGKASKNIILDHAIQLASYIPDDGWMLEEYPEAEFEVHWWMDIPEPTIIIN